MRDTCEVSEDNELCIKDMEYVKDAVSMNGGRCQARSWPVFSFSRERGRA